MKDTQSMSYNRNQGPAPPGGPSGPPPPGGGGGGGDEGKRQGLMSVNDLHYVLPPDLSVSVNRTHTNHYFQNSNYTNSQRAICILNSGALYGDMRDSSLEFGVSLTKLGNTATHKTAGYFGPNGSAVNLIRTLTISSRSGDELVRLDGLDLLSYVTTGHKHGKNWVETVGAAAGYGGVIPHETNATSTVYFSIPLYMLTELFGYGRLMPPMLLSGLRIEIDWQTPNQALCSYDNQPEGKEFTMVPAATTPETSPPTIANGYTPGGVQYADAAEVIGSFNIYNPYVSLYSIQLTDGIQRALNEMSAVNGLEIVYCDYSPTNIGLASGNTSSNTAVQLEVRKASSRALKAFLVTRDNAKVNNPLVDSYQSEDWAYRRWQWQLGALYFPQQPVVSTSAGTNDSTRTVYNNLAESYKHLLITNGTYKDQGGKCSAIPFRSKNNYLNYDFHQTAPREGQADADTPWRFRPIYDTNEINRGTHVIGPEQLDGMNVVPPVGELQGDFGTFCNGNSLVSVLLERSDLFNLSGVPINNSRVLSARVEFSSVADRARDLTVFLKYVRLARVFLNNVEVEQ